jgi:outer membrane protein assembly factor BamE (lipoprotein component of BamABCDE complex)
MVNASPKAASAGRRVRRGAQGGAALAALLLLGGCSLMPDMPPPPGTDMFSSPSQMRGNMVEDEDLRQITVGVSSRSDVQALLGSPSQTSTFDDSEWFYIGAITRQRPGRLLGIEDQQVIVVRFDARGTVREIRRLGPEDGRDVVAVTRTTPSPGNERTMLQQLFGNIGRVGPGLGAQQGGPGAPGPGSAR